MSEWIRVSERLPEDGQTVLAYLTYPPDTIFVQVSRPLISCPYVILEFHEIDMSFNDRSMNKSKFVSHWKELPKKPHE